VNGQAAPWGEGGELSFRVVGGRLGAYAAMRLSEEGYDVILYEPRPGEDAVCGGLVNGRVVKRYKFLREAEVWRIDGAVIRAGGEELVVERKGVASVVDRGLMHRILIEEAQARGVKLVRSKYYRAEGPVVAADGALSIFRRYVTKKEPEYILALQGTAPWGQENYVYVDFGPWAPGFFGWVIPTGEQARIGIGVPLELAGRARHLLLTYAKYLGTDIKKIGGRVIPLGPLPRVAGNNIFLVGDAAATTKATTGGGISLGLQWIDILVDNLEGDVNRAYRISIYPKLLLHRIMRHFILKMGAENILPVVGEMKAFLEKRGDMDDPFSLLGAPLLKTIFRSVFRALHIPP